MRNEGEGQGQGEGQGIKDEKAEAKDCEMSMDVTLLDKASERVGFLGGHFTRRGVELDNVKAAANSLSCRSGKAKNKKGSRTHQSRGSKTKKAQAPVLCSYKRTSSMSFYELLENKAAFLRPGWCCKGVSSSSQGVSLLPNVSVSRSLSKSEAAPLEMEA